MICLSRLLARNSAPLSSSTSLSPENIADHGVKIDTENLSSEQFFRVRQMLGS